MSLVRRVGKSWGVERGSLIQKLSETKHFRVALAVVLLHFDDPGAGGLEGFHVSFPLGKPWNTGV